MDIGPLPSPETITVISYQPFMILKYRVLPDTRTVKKGVILPLKVLLVQACTRTTYSRTFLQSLQQASRSYVATASVRGMGILLVCGIKGSTLGIMGSRPVQPFASCRTASSTVGQGDRRLLRQLLGAALEACQAA